MPEKSNVEITNPDLVRIVDRCAIVIEQEGCDSPFVYFKTMMHDEFEKNGLFAYQVACKWLESLGYVRSKTVKRSCDAYYERGGNRAYVTSNIRPLQILLNPIEEGEKDKSSALSV